MVKKAMRPALLAVCVFLAGASTLEARPERLFGFKAGFNSGQLRATEDAGDYDVENFRVNRGSAGIAANFGLNRFLSFQPELLFFVKGGKYRVGVPVGVPGIAINVTDTRSLTYLEIPMLLKATLPLKFALKPTFLAGPSVGVNLGGRLKNRIEIVVPGYQFAWYNKEGIRDQVKDIELSLVVGGGFDIDLPKGKLVVDQRFFFGLSANNYQVTIPASDFQAIGIPITEDIVYRLDMNNYVFAVSIGYLF